MSTMLAFSRLQLAAALIEYDNDSDDLQAPRRSAYDSAIFAHLRRANGNIHATKPEKRNQDFLGVKLPSDSGALSVSDKETSLGQERMRRSKYSIATLHNPFGQEEEEVEEEVEREEKDEDSDLEVDLKSWGLDSIIPEEKPKKSKKDKGKAKSEIIPNTVGIGARSPKHDRPGHSRTVSMPLGDFGEGPSNFRERRNTISDPLSVNEMGLFDTVADNRRFASHPLIDDLPARRTLALDNSSVPFPIDRNASEMNIGGNGRPVSIMSSTFDARASQFAIPPPPPSRASRFDPKYQAHVRAISNATHLSGATTQLPYEQENDVNAVQQQAPSSYRASALNVDQSRDRRMSTFSMRTQDMLNDDFQSQYPAEELPPRERGYSRMDLMRPKILVMPSPLQNSVPTQTPANKSTPRGFIDSSDGRPMPSGARGNRMSVLGPSSSTNIPVPSNSFTPNPRMSLSASQLLFRNTLLVDGQRDITYNDIDGDLRRAQEDGVQVKLEFPDRPILPEIQVAELPPDQPTAHRPAGKLYGRSLIDALEDRKTEMKSKKRVFTGDQRPSMMDRAMTRSSTLIDPATLPSRPHSMLLPTSQTEPALSRSGSKNNGPLLAMDSSGNIAEAGETRKPRLTNARSVFGVDTLWEREMAKLKEIEAQEKIEAEEKKMREEELESKMPAKRKKGKKKGKGSAIEESKSTESLASPASLASPSSQPSASPIPDVAASLTLPVIPTVTSRRRVAPVPDDDELDGESSASEAAVNRAGGENDKLADQWVSDDEKPAPPVSAGRTNVPQITVPAGDDSDDEEEPLSVALQRAAQRKSMLLQTPENDDSDEDRPLSMLLLNKADVGSSSSPNLGDIVNFDSKPSLSLPKSDDDEDNEPLGIRASRLPTGASQLSFASSPVGGGGDDDERPLSMHPSQIRKSQFNLFSQFQQQQQQQQQQQMLQAQMANSMSFNPHQSMMFMMPPAPFIPQPQMQVPMAAPEQQQPNKFSSVDRWRRDVAVEGQP